MTKENVKKSKKPRIAVLSVSAGSGHVRAAQAVCAAAALTDVDAIHFDVMDYVPKLFRKFYADTYFRPVQLK